MKKIMILAAFAAAVFTSCVKDPASLQTQTQTVYFNAGAASTKAYFDTPTGNTYPVLWSDEDTDVALSVNLGDIKKVSTEISTDHKTAKFSYETPAAASYQFVVVNPYYALRSVNSSAKTIRVEIPSGQECTNTSPDRMAIVMSGLSDPITTLPGTVDIEMNHISAYLHLTFSNVDLQGATVQSVNIVSAKKLAGRFYQKADKSLEADDDVMFGTVGVKTHSLDNVWAGVFPADLSNQTIGVQIVTDQGTFSKGIQFGNGHAMESGKIYKIAVDMTGVSPVPPVEYVKVTDPSQLYAGDKVIVVAETSDIALSTVQNGNNRSGAGVSRSDDGSKLYNPSSAIEILNLEDGHKPGLWALKATSAASPGYLYAADTNNKNNYLRTKDNVDASASWNIAINDDANKTAHITADLVGCRNLLRFNEESNLFSAYASTTAMLKVNLYRKNEPGASWLNVTMPTYSANISSAEATFPVYVFGDVAWTASVTGGGSLDVTSGTGPKILTLTIPQNTDTANSRDITVTVTTTATVAQTQYSFTMTQAAQPALAVFPITWSMPAISATWQSGVDYDCSSKANPWIYSDGHAGKLTLNRFGTDPTNAPNYQYISSTTSTEVIAGGRMYSCGVYEGDYWLFEVYSVQNPAGTYNISYKTCSTNAGPRVFLLQYSIDDGANWVNIHPTTAALTLNGGASYDSGKEYTYTYITSPNFTNNELATVNESFHIDAISTKITLKIRALVAAKMKNDGSGNMSSDHHGGAHRLGGNVAITFTAD